MVFLTTVTCLNNLVTCCLKTLTIFLSDGEVSLGILGNVNLLLGLLLWVTLTIVFSML